MDKLNEILEKCSQVLQAAPKELHVRFSKIFDMVYVQIKDNPEVIKKTTPILLNICAEIVKGNHWGAFNQGILLLVLLGRHGRNKTE